MTSCPARTPGGRRTLGSAKASSPAATAAVDPRPHPHHHSSGRLLSPSESSVSLTSPSPRSPASTTDSESLTARVSLHHSHNAAIAVAAASASSRLVCPICNEDMVTLLQLNRHLDDLHENLEDVEQDDIQNWFRTQMIKAKKFQPLAVLNQKLKGLDVFESNDSPLPPAPAQFASSQSRKEQPRPLDPEELVTRAHWQRTSSSDACSEPTCAARLGATNGCVNCRMCGRLFCEEHTMYQMRLSRSAQHEPVRGIWGRVCETCYKSRLGYNDHIGAERDHSAAFAAMRRKHVDKANLDIGRLEKRLTKLTHLLATASAPAQQPGAASLIWSLSGAKAQQRVLEQSIIDWEDDASVLQCPFCQQEFTTYTFRRHHCRLCGRVVCGDANTSCSTDVGLSVSAPTDASSEKPAGQVNVDVRMCRACKHTLFSKSDFAREATEQPRDGRAYENLVRFERGIRLLLPRFHKLLAALQHPDQPPSASQLRDAAKVRKRLMDAFAQYDTAARRMRDLPAPGPVQARLQRAVCQQAYNFLNLHMLPLKSLPKILKHASPRAARPSKSSSPTLSPASNGVIRYHHHTSGTSSSSTTTTTTNDDDDDDDDISALEDEEKALREQLIVLEEQRFFVQQMLADASRHRRFDEAAALSRSLDDLGPEIDRLTGQLNALDFAAAYTGAAVPESSSLQM